jgi:hypothetical protein
MRQIAAVITLLPASFIVPKTAILCVPSTLASLIEWKSFLLVVEYVVCANMDPEPKLDVSSAPFSLLFVVSALLLESWDEKLSSNRLDGLIDEPPREELPRLD